jgi:uncharacterized protein (TIGR03437 family)
MFTLTPEESGPRSVDPSVTTVTLTVGAIPTTTNTVLACCFEFIFPSGAGLSYAYRTPPGVMPGAFSTSVATEGGGNWLSISPASGTHPSNFTIAANPANLPAGRYGGVVLITSSGGTIYMPVTLRVYGGVQLKPDTFALVFRAEAGKPPPFLQSVSVVPECLYSGCPAAVPASIPSTASVKTYSGGNWLSAVSRAGDLLVSVNSASLQPGVYAGAVTLSSPAASGPTVVPVVLVIRSGSLPAIAAIPASLSVRAKSGLSSPAGMITIKAGESEINFDASASTTDGGGWLGVSQPVSNIFGILNVLYGTAGLAPGTYTGKVTVTASGQTLTIPVRLVIERPPQPLAPMLGSVVSAASAMPGPVAPGEIVTIRGMGLSPSALFGYPPPSLDPPRVFFDGIPAPVLFASATRVNAVVPDRLAGKTAATLELQYGYLSATWGVPVVAAAPGIFTLDSSGQGPAAVLNQDNSVNSPSRPATRGSVIQVFATGFGASRAAGVVIGGIDAQVTFAGPAPGSVAGLFQVNAVVPPEVTAGPAVSIVLTVGPFRSQDGVTIAGE